MNTEYKDKYLRYKKKYYELRKKKLEYIKIKEWEEKFDKEQKMI